MAIAGLDRRASKLESSLDYVRQQKEAEERKAWREKNSERLSWEMFLRNHGPASISYTAEDIEKHDDKEEIRAAIACREMLQKVLTKYDCIRRSKFDPLFKLTNLLEYKVHVSLPSAKALSVHVQDQCVMCNPIENCGGKGSVMEHLYPVRESQIRRNDRTHRLVSRCQQLKEQFRASEVESDIPEFIDDQEIDLLELPEIGGEPVFVSRLNHLIDQTCCRPERNPIILFTGEDSDCNRHMCLPGS